MVGILCQQGRLGPVTVKADNELYSVRVFHGVGWVLLTIFV